MMKKNDYQIAYCSSGAPASGSSRGGAKSRTLPLLDSSRQKTGLARRIAILIILLYSLPAFAGGLLPFLPKTFNELPDNYGITITYVTGKQEQFEVASHNLNKETGTFEFVTKDDIWNWVPISSIQRLEFDKRFSKIVAAKEKEAKKQAAESGKK